MSPRMTPEQTVVAYASTWAERDEGRRLATLETCWAPDGLYLDPTGHAEGRDALCEHIAQFQQIFPDHSIELAGAVDEHDGYLCFAWKMSGPGNDSVLNGLDFGQLDREGRLKLICGFFGLQLERGQS